jgi:ribosomal protein S18 acetylase RimI-like enzyme
MTGDIVIRSAEDADFAPLCALYCESVRCNPAGFIQDLNYHGCLIAKTRAWREAGGDMLVGVYDGRVVALGGLAPHSDTHVELCKLHVNEAMQGRGLGRSMTEHLIDLAHQHRFSEIILHVTTTQKAAIRLYHSIGFQPVKQEVFETTIFDEHVAYDTLHMRLPIRGVHATALAS